MSDEAIGCRSQTTGSRDRASHKVDRAYRCHKLACQHGIQIDTDSVGGNEQINTHNADGAAGQIDEKGGAGLAQTVQD